MKRRLTSVLVTLVVALVGFGLFWNWWSNINLAPIVVPAKKMPSPNAYDFYTRAYAAMPEEPKARLLRPPGTEVEAAPMVSMMKTSEPQPEDNPTDPRIPLEKKVAALKKYEKSLTILRQGLRYPYASPRYRSIDEVFEKQHFTRARRLARVLRLESYVDLRQGEYGKAMGTVIDGLQVGMDTANNCAIAALVGFAIDNISLPRDPDEIVSHLTAAECRSAARRLENVVGRRYTMPQVMEEERFVGSQELGRLLQNPIWRSAFVTGYDLEKDRETTSAERSYQTALAYFYTKRGVSDWYQKNADRAIVRAGLPYSQTKTLPESNRSGIFSVVSAADGLVFKVSLDRVPIDQLLLTLALRAYKLEHGAYPITLSQLAPTYLKSIPNDPFGTGPYIYKLKRNSYLLYSFGPDCKDDGGRPIVKKEAWKDSLGDMVVRPE